MIIPVKPDAYGNIDIFYEGDENVTQVHFENPDSDFKWALHYLRRGDKRPYNVPLDEADGELIWTVSLADTEKPGAGFAQLVGSAEGQTKHSRPYTVTVGKSLGKPGSVPSAEKAFGDAVAADAAAAKRAAEDAAGSAQAAADTLAQVKDDLAAGKLKGEKGDKGDPGKDAPQIDDAVISADSPWSSKKIVETLCPALEETGNPVTCYPVAGYPLGVVASWEPTQAGEGEPYPAGGGKNVIPYPANSHKYPQSRNGLTVTSNANGSYTVNGTATANTYFSICDLTKLGIDGFEAFTISGCPKGGATNMFYLALYDGAKWTTDTGDGNTGTIGTIATGARIEITIVAGYTANNLVFWPQLEKGSAPTAYAPYENIRPISGRTEISVERCGKNLLKITPFAKTVNKGITFEYVAPGGIKISGTATALSDSPLFVAPCFPPGRYYGTDINNINASIVVTRDGARYWQNTKGIFAIKAGDIPHYWYISINAGTTIDTVVYPYIVPGTTAPTAYTPYQGDTLDLQLPGTVYGGCVDAVTGEGESEWAFKALDGTEKWNTWGVNANNATVTGFYTYDISDYAIEKLAVVCSNLPAVADVWGGKRVGAWFATSGTSHYFIYSIPSVVLGDISDNAHAIASLKSYLAAQAAAGTPVQVAYKLATPTPITATGAQPIPALAGCNTILTDADTVTITGRADPAHAIAALQAQLAVATQQLVETQAAMVDTTAMAVDYIYQQDLEDIGVEEVDDG